MSRKLFLSIITISMMGLFSCTSRDIDENDIATFKQKCDLNIIAINGPFGFEGGRPPNLILDPTETSFGEKYICTEKLLAKLNIRAVIVFDGELAASESEKHIIRGRPTAAEKNTNIDIKIT